MSVRVIHRYNILVITVSFTLHTRKTAKEEIRNCLLESRYSEAIATLRICRNKLSEETDDFGKTNANLEEELLCLKNIFIQKDIGILYILKIYSLT